MLREPSESWVSQWTTPSVCSPKFRLRTVSVFSFVVHVYFRPFQMHCKWLHNEVVRVAAFNLQAPQIFGPKVIENSVLNFLFLSFI